VRIFAARLRNEILKQEFIENIERDNEVKEEVKRLEVCKSKIRVFSSCEERTAIS